MMSLTQIEPILEGNLSLEELGAGFEFLDIERLATYLKNIAEPDEGGAEIRKGFGLNPRNLKFYIIRNRELPIASSKIGYITMQKYQTGENQHTSLDNEDISLVIKGLELRDGTRIPKSKIDIKITSYDSDILELKRRDSLIRPFWFNTPLDLSDKIPLEVFLR